MNIIIEVNPKHLEDVLTTAGEQGSGYWCRSDRHLTQALKRKVGIRVIDDDSNEKRELSPRDVRKGLELLAKAASDHDVRHVRHLGSSRAAEVLGEVLCGTADAEEADIFVQVCVFGEVRFG